MEVTLLEARNTPSTPVLAVQVGAMPPRQAGLEVGRSFLVPHTRETAGPLVEMMLFNQISSALLPDDCTETYCSVPVKKPNGSSGEVKLSVRRKAPKNGAAADATAAPKLGYDYLEMHALTDKVQGLIEDVCRDTPDDPFRYMLERLRRSKAEAAANSVLVPKPPDGSPNSSKGTARRRKDESASKAPLVPKPPDGQSNQSKGPTRRSLKLEKAVAQEPSDGQHMRKKDEAVPRRQDAEETSAAQTIGPPTCQCGRAWLSEDVFCENCGSKRTFEQLTGSAPPPPPNLGGASSRTEVAIDPARTPQCDDPCCADDSCLPADAVPLPGGGRAKFDVRVDKPIRTRAGVKPLLFVHDHQRTVEAIVQDDQQPAFSVLWERVSSTGGFKAYFRARLGSDGLVYIDTSRRLKRTF